jgi:gluconolactonase
MQKIALGIAIISLLSACNDSTTTANNTPADSSAPAVKTIGSIERLDPALDAIMKPDAKAEIIADGFDWSEGPVWISDQKMLLWSDIPPNKIYKWTEAGGKELYLTPSGYTSDVKRGGEVGSNGLILHDGKLVLCQHGDRRMAYMDAPLSAPQPKFVTIADKYQGKKINSPNDAVYRSNGDLFFTDPPYGLEKNVDDPLKEIRFQGVYKVTPKGEVTLLVDSITRPNGIGFTPDEKTLIVANSDGAKAVWYMFSVGADDKLTPAGLLYDATEAGKTEKGAPDGFKIDKQGNIFATGPGGIWIFNKDKKLVGKIKLTESASNVALGEDEKTIFITNDMYVLRVKLRD